MKRMMKHEDDDLAEHRAGIGLEELVGDAERQRADQRAPEIADAAEHHDHEAVDDVALAEIGRDVVDLAERHAGDAGDARAERRRSCASTHGVRMPIDEAMRRFCVTARICRPQRRAVQHAAAARRRPRARRPRSTAGSR